MNNGLDQIWGQPWEEKTVADIVARIRLEFSHLTKEPSVIDICRFKPPHDAA